MRIWIDLANSPHVLFFAPIVRDLERRGVEVAITARDFARTPELARLHGLRAETIGRHGGRSTLGKAAAVAARAAALLRFARRARPDLALGHNSYAQALAARALRVPSVTLMDYEHTPANHVCFRLADRILLPAAISDDDVARYGAAPSRIARYDGFKEQVYLEEFEPDRGRLDGGLPADLWERFVVAVARPPADFAVYHRFENPLFEEWLRRAGSDPAARVVLLPRTPEQDRRARSLGLPSVVIPERPLDGANLVAHADLVVSAGGTMNREAAILGVPAYSLFAWRPAAVGRALADRGRLTFVRGATDLHRIRLERKPPAVRLRNPGLRARIVESILASGRRAATPEAIDSNPATSL